MLKKYIYIISGFIALGLGVLGIFLPVLPTTPFLLLSAACFSKGSKRFYDALLANKYLGNYIKNYRDKKGLPIREKIITGVLLWVTISISAIFFVDPLWLKFLLFIIAISVSIHLIILKTYKAEKTSDNL